MSLTIRTAVFVGLELGMWFICFVTYKKLTKQVIFQLTLQTSAGYTMWLDGNSWFYIPVYEYKSPKHRKISDLPMVVGCIIIIRFKIETYGGIFIYTFIQTFIYERFWYKTLGAVPLEPVGGSVQHGDINYLTI